MLEHAAIPPDFTDKSIAGKKELAQIGPSQNRTSRSDTRPVFHMSELPLSHDPDTSSWITGPTLSGQHV